MKNTYTTLLLLILAVVSCRNNGTNAPLSYNEETKNDTILNKYKIVNIKNIQDKVYVICAQKGDSIFKIVSEKEKHPPILCKLVKEDDIVMLNLVQIFPYKSLFGVELSGTYYTTVRGININGVMIEIEENSNNSLYKAGNLKGLCIKE
jgi:hypothetical protein